MADNFLSVISLVKIWQGILGYMTSRERFIPRDRVQMVSGSEQSCDSSALVGLLAVCQLVTSGGEMGIQSPAP